MYRIIRQHGTETIFRDLRGFFSCPVDITEKVRLIGRFLGLM